MTDAFDRWAANAADPPRCPVCSSLLRTGSADGVGTRVIACPLGCQPVKCSSLPCEFFVGPDGCWHLESEPFCSACLTNCPECRAAIAWDMAPGGAA